MPLNNHISSVIIMAAFLDVKKAFDNIWHNERRHKIYQLDKLCK